MGGLLVLIGSILALKPKRLLKTGGIVAAAALLTGAAASEPGYPDGFRAWAHVHSGVVLEGSPAYERFGGLHEIYGNAIAMRDYPKGRYSNGSVFVFDVHNVAIAKGSIEPTSRRQVDVMIKQGGAWKFFEFRGDSRSERSVTAAQGEQECAACHNKAPRDHVFHDPVQAPSMPQSN